MRKQIVWEQDQKVQNLTLEELQNTADYKGAGKHEVSHHKLLTDLTTDLTSRGYDAKLSELWVSKTGIDKPTLHEVEKHGYLNSVDDVRGLIVRNCVGRIDIQGNGYGDKNSNQQIAISYNKQGIALAFGQHISVCANLQIFGGQMMQNYGTSSLPMMRMLEIMASWIQNMKQFRRRDTEIMEILKSREIDPMHEVDEVVGNLHRLVEMNIKNKKVVSPLNHSRTNELQRGMLGYEGELATAYDFLQAATQVSTHQDTIENRLANTSDLGSYFQARYNANIDIVLNDAETVEVV